jgi:hypothetical protein
MNKSKRSGRGSKAENQKHTSGITRGNLGHGANKIAQRLLASTGVRGDSPAPVKQPAAAVEVTAPHNAALHNNVPEVPGEAATVDKDVTVVSADQSTELIDVPTAPAVAENLPHDSTNGSDCGPSQNNKVSVPELELAEASPEGQSGPAKEVTAATADPARQPADVPTAPAAAEVPASTGAAAVTKNEGRNGDETDARMEEIQKILEHAATPVLDKCALTAEWVRHAEAKASGFGQVVAKPQGGRPEGGITRAAKELPVRGKTLGARRKVIERAIKIDAIWAEAKFAIRAAKLDNIQSALLAIANEQSLEDQLVKVQEIKTRPRGSGRNNSTQPEANSGTDMTREDVNATSIPPIAYEALTLEQKEHLAVLQRSWRKDKVVYREDFEKAPLVVQQYFFWNDMVATSGNQQPAQLEDADPADPTPSTMEFPTAPTETETAGSASGEVSAQSPTSSSEEQW